MRFTEDKDNYLKETVGVVNKKSIRLAKIGNMK